jgi:glycosyltransferase involved in cell wall biosynthesis
MSAQGAWGYLVSRYPGITHTFIVGEVRALREAGARIETASVRRVPKEQILSAVDREEYERTYALLPASIPRLLGAHVRAFVGSPNAYFRTLADALRLAHAGGRPRLWQLFYFGEAVLLWRWLVRKGLTHVHVHHANVSADVAMLACRYANTAGASPRWTWSFTLHGPTELLDVVSHKLPEKVADAAAVICTSDYARSQVAIFAEAGDLDKVRTVRCGIDVSAFQPQEGARSGDRDGCEILCVAALSRRKGHHVLLHALAMCRAQDERAHLVLAGDGAERERLEALAAELGIADAVRFDGAVGHDRVPSLYASADVFCLPSFAEGVPTVLMEAMATGLPVVATNINGVAELVDDEQTGLLVAPARADLLAAALARMTNDPELRARMGEAGRRRVIERYELRTAVDNLRAVIGPLSGV